MGVGMSDYKELISNLRYCLSGECGGCTLIEDIQRCQERLLEKAADSIEQFVKERDAAIADLEKVADCRTCGKLTQFCQDNPDACKGYVWRGVQEVEHGKAD